MSKFKELIKQWARWYFKHGFKVIPLLPGTKRPFLKDWTVKEDIDIAFFEKGCNIGIKTGKLKDNILDRIFWKNSKNHLILRFSAAILNSNNRNLKGLVTFFRWITSDLIFKMILGNVFKIYPSAFLVSMKNLLVSIFLKLPYRLFIKPFLKI